MMIIKKRSYLAFVLTPEPPIFEWLSKLDEWTSQVAGYFVSKPVVLDLSAVRSSNAAEIIAGGSIHVYGALRGRTSAGTAGTPRIFCSKLEAELLAIDGCYCVADDIAPSLCSKPVQAWLKGDAMLIARLQ